MNKSLVFAPGLGLTQCVHIPILADDCLELNESFSVSITVDHAGVTLSNSEVTVYIEEDDGKSTLRVCMELTSMFYA
jgi:uncharacterized protein YneR